VLIGAVAAVALPRIFTGRAALSAAPPSAHPLASASAPTPVPGGPLYPPQPTATAPGDQAAWALQWQAGAVAEGNEAKWMAAVDPGQPKLQARYRNVFRTLRALGSTQVEYTPSIGKADRKDPSALVIPVDMYYCYGTDTCGGGVDPPRVRQSLTMKEIGGHWLIVGVAADPAPEEFDPAPWEDGTLVVSQGSRVTVAAEPSETKYLAQVLPLAEKAAATNDPFAATLHAEQKRFRVFLAGEKQWHRWYGGDDTKWVVGMSVPINQYGFDVVLRVRSLHTVTETQVTLQHEFGHVITLYGAQGSRARDNWLAEGVAEYIGWSPRPAAGSMRRSSVRWQIARKRPATMIPKDPGANASVRAGDAYYGLSHFAVDCMATVYGRDKMFRVVREVLVHSETYDVAAHDAYGIGFAKVDKTCTGWIRSHA
jgi:hypothetical protein